MRRDYGRVEILTFWLEVLVKLIILLVSKRNLSCKQKKCVKPTLFVPDLLLVANLCGMNASLAKFRF